MPTLTHGKWALLIIRGTLAIILGILMLLNLSAGVGCPRYFGRLRHLGWYL
jgi:uncharacterized membrane protein HdeD (DUF308 family)